ncbi:MAG: MerR family transcriptional regulator [Paracoccaceae bacterium]
MEKSPDAFRTISEVSEWLETPAHVLRFWESRFAQVKPVKRAGGRRYYRPSDMLLLGGIKKLLHEDGMTIRGVQKILREKGVKHVSGLSQPLDGAEEAPALEPAEPSAPETGARPEPTPEPPAEAAPPTAREEAPALAPSNVVRLSPSAPQPDLFAESEAQAAPEPETRPAAPAPLGAELPAEDPADESVPARATLRARLRDPALRRRLTTRDTEALADVLARLTELRARLGQGE